MTEQIDEASRQRALDSYRIVDSIPEAAYNDIVRIASILCDTPIALVSLVDRDRQWFKASKGLAVNETSRDVAFCDHAIRVPDQLMHVPDARLDARFVDNPLVTGELGIRFYAGMPLVTPGGAAMGTICVIDNTPRELDARQREGLAALARLTMTLLEARHRESELERALIFARQETVGPTPEPQMPDNGHCTVAIFEVQDLAGGVQRAGERAVTRSLLKLEQSLHAQLRNGSSDSVNHATGSADLIAVLQGEDTGATLAKMRDCIPAFEAETKLRVLSAAANSEAANERIENIFLRADSSLSAEKDAYRAAA